MVKDLTLTEINEIGVGIQKGISDQMSALLQGTKCLDIGKSGDEIASLSIVTDKVTKRISNSLGKRNFLSKVFPQTKRWLKRFESLESSIDGITDAVQAESDRLDSILTGLVSSIDVMTSNLDQLEGAKSSLKELISFYEENPNLDPNGFKSQAAVGRLKVLTTTSSLTAQEISKAVLIIQENKEVSNQLREASENLVPMFKTMMINVVAAKANEEAVTLRKNLIKVANGLVIETAKSISDTADNLIEGRKDSLISPKTLDEANKIIQSAVKRAIESSKMETSENMRVIQSLEESSKQVQSLYSLEDAKC